MVIRRSSLWVLLLPLFLAGLQSESLAVQQSPRLIPGPNINMVSGTFFRDPVTDEIRVYGGDEFLERQNEPSIAVSRRNSLHLLAGSNDYRTVSLPFDAENPPLSGTAQPSGDTWLGLYTSYDGGHTWQSSLHPGSPQECLSDSSSPLCGYDAGADPTIRAGDHGLFYYSGIAFDRGQDADGAVFVSTFIDLNNISGDRFDPPQQGSIKHSFTTVVDLGNEAKFLDKPWIAVDPNPSGKRFPGSDGRGNIWDPNADQGNGGWIDQSQVPCSTVYLAYGTFQGETNIHSRIHVSESNDCGFTWSKPEIINQTLNKISQGVSVEVAPNGDAYVSWRQFDDGKGFETVVVAKKAVRSKKWQQVYEFPAFSPYDQLMRPAVHPIKDEITGEYNDPFRAIRTSAYPTMAIDNANHVYLAWSQRGWQDENGQWVGWDGGDQKELGSRIVWSVSTDGGNSFTTPQPVDLSPAGDGSGDTCAPGEPCKGHQIMPIMAYSRGKIVIFYYDFRESPYPEIFDRILEIINDGSPVTDPQSGNTYNNWLEFCRADCGDDLECQEICTLLDVEGYERSWPTADAIAFDPLPVRHTVDVFISEAAALGAQTSFEGPPTKVSSFETAFVVDEEATIDPSQPVYKAVQLRADPTNLPMFGGGELPFLGDYIDMAAADQRASSSSNTASTGSLQALTAEPLESPVLHVTWTSNRDVIPPPPGPDGKTDWSQKDLCDPELAQIRDQNIYSSRLTGGLVISSLSNSKPLKEILPDGSVGDPITRSFPVRVENTSYEYLELPDRPWVRHTKVFELSVEEASGVCYSFRPFNTCSEIDPNDRTKLVEVANNSSITETLFVRLANSNQLLPKIRLRALRIETPTSPLQPEEVITTASLLLNPDPYNPVPLNLDEETGTGVGEAEIHDPEFLKFQCDVFLFPFGDHPNSGPDYIAGPEDSSLGTFQDLFPLCSPGEETFTLVTTWPDLLVPDLTNPSKLVLNPRVTAPRVTAPRVTAPRVTAPRVTASALLNPATVSSALLNPRVTAGALLSAGIANPRVTAPRVTAPRVTAPRVTAPRVTAPRVTAAAVLNPRVTAPRVTAPRVTASTIPNSTVLSTPIDETEVEQELQSLFENGDLYATGPGEVFDPLTYPNRSFTDYTWMIRNDGNDTAGYIVKVLALFGQFTPRPAEAQLILYRVYRTIPLPTACSVDNLPTGKADELVDFEILANAIVDGQAIENPEDFASTISVPPGVSGDPLGSPQIFITLRVLDENGDDGIPQIPVEQVAAAVIPQAPNTGEVPVITTIQVTPNSEGSLVFSLGTPIDVTVRVLSTAGIPTGQVNFFLDDALSPFDSCQLSDGLCSPTNGITPPAGEHQIVARYVEAGAFTCGTETSSGLPLANDCDSQPAFVTIDQADSPPDVTLDYLPKINLTFGTEFQLIGTVEGFPGIPPTGTLTFTVDGISSGPLPLATLDQNLGVAEALYPNDLSLLLNVNSVIIITYSGDTNYPGTTTDPGDFSVPIDPAEPQFSLTASDCEYTGLPCAASGFVYGIGGPDDVLESTPVLAYLGTDNTVYSSGEAPTEAGTYQVVARFAGNANYVALDSEPALFSIQPRSIEITAHPQTKIYGEQDPVELTFRISSGSLVNGDQFSGSLSREIGEDTGSYAILQGSLTLDANYSLNFVGADFIISARPITITADPKTKTYGELDPEFTFAVTTGSLVNGDSVSGTLSRESGEDTGAYAIQQGTLTAGSNYHLTFISDDLTITARTITVTADEKTKVYGETDPPFTFQVTDGSLASGDTFIGSLSREAGEDVGSYQILKGSLALNGNYAFSFIGADLTISTRSIAVTADPATKIFGSPDPPLTYQVTTGSLVDGDLFSGSLTRVAGEEIGVYPILQGTLSAGSNYSLTYTGADFTITSAYVFIGFNNPLGPVGGTTGPFNLGKTIPAKWTLSDQEGNPISDLLAIDKILVSGGCPGGLDPDAGATATGGTELRGSNQYVFNWDTSGLSGPCHQLQVHLIDGSSHWVNVKFE